MPSRCACRSLLVGPGGNRAWRGGASGGTRGALSGVGGWVVWIARGGWSHQAYAVCACVGGALHVGGYRA